MELMVNSGGEYRAATLTEISEAYGAQVLARFNELRPTLGSPKEAIGVLRDVLAGRDYEVFMVLFLDNRHGLIEASEMFRGTIDGASVHPREVVKAALFKGAAAVVLAHNHPSGVAEPSQADELITIRLREALALIEVRVLDHIIVAGRKHTTFSERGLL